MQRIFLSDLISQFSIALDRVEQELLGCQKFHGKRVAVMVLAMGRHLGYDAIQLFNLAACALMHDNALTEYILSEQPGEGQLINLKSHCIIGQENCEFFPFPGNIDGFITYHHECANGSGPFGKKEGEYPQEAGLIALADQIDVRFYTGEANQEKIEKIREYIKEQKGKKYDTAAVEAALAILDTAFFEGLKEDALFSTLQTGFPEVLHGLSNSELVRIAGIIAKIIDYKSNFTREHSIQIANKAWYMGQIYGYSEEMNAMIYLSAAFHDVGKLYISNEILEKPGKLSNEDFEEIKNHVLYTWVILKQVRGFEQIAVWASNHHEKLDGSGYPFHKTADELDFISRLLACLDIYQAVREARPYHPMRSHKDTMEILFDMAEKGLVDKTISRDLDLYLSEIENGVAPYPSIS